MKLKTVKANPKTMTKAKKLVKGLTLEWEDENPLVERKIASPKVGHKNPITRLFSASIVADFSNTIFKNMRFKWRITITLFFKYPNRDKYEEEIILDADCVLNDLNDVCLSEIKTELKRHHENAFYNTRFFIECIGL